MSRAVDLFDGCGGWAEGARALGLHPVGIEIDADACASSRAAGSWVIRGDVTAIEPLRFRSADGLIASPPCPDFSTAGKRAGIEGETGKLMREVPRWVEAIRPRWVACEQVPPALEWWERFAHDFAKLGYRCWTGILNAADYGVPQTRQRAFLLASLDRQPRPPEPTHTRHPMPGLFGDDRLPWVSMAAALGWDGFEAQYKRGAGMIERHGPRPARDCAEPAPTLTGSALGAGAGAKMSFVRTGNNSHVTSRTGSKAGDGGVQVYERSVDEPAPTLDAKVGGAWRVTLDRRQNGAPILDAEAVPAPTMTAAAMGKGVWQAKCDNEVVRLTIRDALILQSFRPDYPLHGNKTSQFRQVGNAVPPLLAQAVLSQLLASLEVVA